MVGRNDLPIDILEFINKFALPNRIALLVLLRKAVLDAALVLEYALASIVRFGHDFAGSSRHVFLQLDFLGDAAVLLPHLFPADLGGFGALVAVVLALVLHGGISSNGDPALPALAFAVSDDNGAALAVYFLEVAEIEHGLLILLAL